MPTLSVEQYGIIFNFLSFTIASMSAATLFFFLSRGNVAPTLRPALTLTGLVTAIAAYHYVMISLSFQGAYVLEGVAGEGGAQYVASGKPFNDAYRYVDWLLTVPLLLIELLLVMRLSRQETWNKGFLLGGLAALMIILGYPGEVSDNPTTIFLFWFLSMIPFLIIVFQLFTGLTDAIERQPAGVRELVGAARWILVLSWFFYPIVYLAQLAPGFSGPDVEIALQIGYSIADLVSKAVFGVVIYMIAMRKTEAAQSSM
ncbi:MAG: bacteriorhodopsin-like [Candidatus Competibacterales bacterium]